MGAGAGAGAGAGGVGRGRGRGDRRGLGAARARGRPRRRSRRPGRRARRRRRRRPAAALLLRRSERHQHVARQVRDGHAPRDGPLGVEEPRVHGQLLQAFREGLARAAALLGRREHARRVGPGHAQHRPQRDEGLPEQRLARARLEDQRPQVPEDALLPQQRPRGGDVRGAERGHAERRVVAAGVARRRGPHDHGPRRRLRRPGDHLRQAGREAVALVLEQPDAHVGEGPQRVRLLPADRDARDDERDVRPDRPVDARPVGRDPEALRAPLDDVVLQERLRAALVQRERRRAGEPAHGQPQEAAGVDVAALRGGRVGGGHRRPGPLVQDLVAVLLRDGARRREAAERARHVPAPPRAGRRRGEARERGAGRRAALVGRLVGQADLEARQRRLAERPQRGLGGDVRLLLRDRGLLPQGRREVDDGDGRRGRDQRAGRAGHARLGPGERVQRGDVRRRRAPHEAEHVAQQRRAQQEPRDEGPGPPVRLEQRVADPRVLLGEHVVVVVVGPAAAVVVVGGGVAPLHGADRGRDGVALARAPGGGGARQRAQRALQRQVVQRLVLRRQRQHLAVLDVVEAGLDAQRQEPDDRRRVPLQQLLGQRLRRVQQAVEHDEVRRARLPRQRVREALLARPAQELAAAARRAQPRQLQARRRHLVVAPQGQRDERGADVARHREARVRRASGTKRESACGSTSSPSAPGSTTSVAGPLRAAASST